jgi:hypothetical protein
MRGYKVELGNFQPDKGECYSLLEPPSGAELIELPEVVAGEFAKREKVTVRIEEKPVGFTSSTLEGWNKVYERRGCPLHCVWVKDGIITDKTYEYA